MLSKRILLSFVAAAALAACGQSGSLEPAAKMPSAAAAPSAPPMPPQGGAAREAGAAEQPARRYLAVSHQIVVATEPGRIEAFYRDVEAKAVALGGEVVSSRFSRDHRERPDAELTLRLPPAKIPAFMATLAQGGELLDSRRDSEDKTAEVIDVEARQKNLSEARDRLRVMLNDRTGKLEDVLQVQRALTDTQSQLDSLAAQRKVLAQLTDMERVTVRFQVTQAVFERGAFAELHDAWSQAGRMFASSLAALLSFVVVTLPWAALFYLLSWPLRRAWRRRREARRPPG